MWSVRHKAGLNQQCDQPVLLPEFQGAQCSTSAKDPIPPAGVRHDHNPTSITDGKVDNSTSDTWGATSGAGVSVSELGTPPYNTTWTSGTDAKVSVGGITPRLTLFDKMPENLGHGARSYSRAPPGGSRCHWRRYYHLSS